MLIGTLGTSAPASAPTPAATPAPATSSNPAPTATTAASGTPAVAPGSPSSNVSKATGAQGIGAFILGLEAQQAAGQAPDATTAGQQTSAVSPEQAQQTPTQPVATPAPQTPEQLIAGKFKTQEELVRAYQNIEQHNTRLAQRHGLPQGVEAQQSVLQQLTALQQENQRLKAQPAQTQAPAQTAQEGTQTQQTADNLGLSEEELSYMINSEPRKLLELMQEQATQAVRAELTAVQQKQQAEQAAQQQKIDNMTDQIFQARTQYSDYDEVQAEMSKIFDANPQLEMLPNSVEIAYRMAKSSRLEQQVASIPRQRPIEELAQDPAVQKQLLDNPALRQAFVAQYATQIRSNQPPVVLTGQSAGSAPAAPAPKATTLREASKNFKAYLESQSTGL